MKRWVIFLTAFGVLGGLGGCAVVPYGAGYPVAQYDPMYPAQPAYAPAYVGPSLYAAPPVYFGFGFNYRDGGHRGYGHRGYGHRGGFDRRW